MQNIINSNDGSNTSLLLDQFGGTNGELKACMQYFVQAFSVRMPYPDKYDLLMDLATEEISHLVEATIQMLLNGINGELKEVEGNSMIMEMLGKKDKMDDMIHATLINPQFLVLTGGGPRLTDSQGLPWQGSYVNANGDLTVDLRSNIAAESRAKIVYENLMKFTDDPLVKETLGFLMTREIAHLQMFEAALATISQTPHLQFSRVTLVSATCTLTCQMVLKATVDPGMNWQAYHFPAKLVTYIKF